MARLLRTALVVAAVVGAFAGGYLMKNVPTFSWAAAEPAPVADATPPPTAKAVTQTTVRATSTVAMTVRVPHPRTVVTHTRTVEVPVLRMPDLAPPPMPTPKAAPSTIILPPIAVAEPPKLDPVDPNDPALRMIKDAMGIKTTILDRSAPLPIVLTDAKRDSEPPLIAPPVPMADPPRKLESQRFDPDSPVIALPPYPAKPVPLLNNRAVE